MRVAASKIKELSLNVYATLTSPNNKWPIENRTIIVQASDREKRDVIELDQWKVVKIDESFNFSKVCEFFIFGVHVYTCICRLKRFL